MVAGKEVGRAGEALGAGEVGENGETTVPCSLLFPLHQHFIAAPLHALPLQFPCTARASPVLAPV